MCSLARAQKLYYPSLERFFVRRHPWKSNLNSFELSLVPEGTSFYLENNWPNIIIIIGVMSPGRRCLI